MQGFAIDKRRRSSVPISALINHASSPRPQKPGLPDPQPQQVHFVKLYGRDYPVWKGNVSPFPWDEAQRDHLDLLHKLIYSIALRETLHLAHLRPDDGDELAPLRILDVGYGTGHWMIDMLERYPRAEITGIDLVPALVPAYADSLDFLSPVDFEQDEWPVQPESQDLIHLALLCGCVRDWGRLYRTAFKYLRPSSGKIEHVEIDWTPRTPSTTTTSSSSSDLKAPTNSSPALQKWWHLTSHASQQTHQPLARADNTSHLLAEAGFTEISRLQIRVPFAQNEGGADEFAISNWFRCAVGHDDPRDRNAWAMLSLRLLVGGLGMGEEEVWRLCEEVVREVNGKGTRVFCYLYVYTARKAVRRTML